MLKEERHENGKKARTRREGRGENEREQKDAADPKVGPVKTAYHRRIEHA